VLNLTVSLKKLVTVTYAVSVSPLGKVFTPKALHPRVQGRVAAKPQSADTMSLEVITSAESRGLLDRAGHIDR